MKTTAWKALSKPALYTHRKLLSLHIIKKVLISSKQLGMTLVVSTRKYKNEKKSEVSIKITKPNNNEWRVQ